MLQGQALIAEMGKRAQRIADEWTPASGPFVQFITFTLCHAYLEGANDALKDEITRHQHQIEDSTSLAAGTRRAGAAPAADRTDGAAARGRAPRETGGAPGGGA